MTDTRQNINLDRLEVTTVADGRVQVLLQPEGRPPVRRTIRLGDNLVVRFADKGPNALPMAVLSEWNDPPLDEQGDPARFNGPRGTAVERALEARTAWEVAVLAMALARLALDNPAAHAVHAESRPLPQAQAARLAATLPAVAAAANPAGGELEVELVEVVDACRPEGLPRPQVVVVRLNRTQGGGHGPRA